MNTLNLDISNIFKDYNSNIFEKIDNLILNGKLQEFEYIDILGEITIDYLNILGKKNHQFEKYKSLIQILEKNPIAISNLILLKKIKK